MRARGFVYANMTLADKARLDQLIADSGQSMSDFVRAALNDVLEDIGVALLEELAPAGRPGRKPRADQESTI
jgi:Arc/MetJ-type ribon-helix-helix transcriptional regulator